MMYYYEVEIFDGDRDRTYFLYLLATDVIQAEERAHLLLVECLRKKLENQSLSFSFTTMSIQLSNYFRYIGKIIEVIELGTT